MADKNMAALILGHKPEPPPDDGGDEGLRSAMEELISAIHAKDVDGAMEAFKAASQMSTEPDGDEGGGD